MLPQVPRRAGGEQGDFRRGARVPPVAAAAYPKVFFLPRDFFRPISRRTLSISFQSERLSMQEQTDLV